ncbi:unnamed protein product [Cunninghamella blakesleeana]
MSTTANQPNKPASFLSKLKATEINIRATNGSKREKQLEERIQREEEEDLKDIDVAGYKKLGKIGEGTYGEVFKAVCKKSNGMVALKRIQLNMFQGGVPTTAIREVALLKEINHNNVIRLLDLIHRETTIYLVFDYLDVDLRRYMDRAGRNGLTLKHIKSFAHQLIRGIHYCHSHRILHRDLKPQNLLIDKTGKLTIADLGLSRAFGVPLRTYTHQVITLWYRAPEILLGSPHYSTAVDMWSVGCIIAEMFTMRPLFPGIYLHMNSVIPKLMNYLESLGKSLGTPTEDMWPGVSALPDYNTTFPPWSPSNLDKILKKAAKYGNLLEPNDYALDLISKLLRYDPYIRLSAKKAEEHMFFYDDVTMLQLQLK